jgi:hypothetical protein
MSLTAILVLVGAAVVAAVILFARKYMGGYEE